MSDRSVSVTLKAVVDGYVNGMKKAEASTKSLTKQVTAAAKQQVMLGNTSRIVGGIGAVALGVKFVQAASKMNETVQKSSVVFKSSQGVINQWATGSAKSMGLSNQAAIESAATMGNLFTSLGVGSGKAAAMSTSMVKLAADFASFNNTDVQTAIDAIQSGLVGEVRPLRQFGVDLSQATLQAKAFEMGLLATKTQAMDPAIRAQAAYALILDQSKNAQGDFARTSDGLANSQRILNASWADAQAKLGQDLMPAVTSGVHGLTAMLDVVNGLPAPVRDVGLAVGAMGVAFLLALPRIIMTRDALLAMGPRGAGIVSGLGAIARAAGYVAIAMTAAHEATNSTYTDVTNAVPKTKMLQGALLDLAQTGGQHGGSVLTSTNADLVSFGDALTRITTPGLWARLTDIEGSVIFQGGAPGLVADKVYIDNIDQALANLVTSGHAKDAAAAYELLTKDAASHGQTAKDVADLLPTYTAAISASGDAAATAGDSTNTAAKAYISFADALTKANQPAADLAHTELDLIDKSKALADSMRTNGDSFSLNTQKGRDNLTVLLDEVDAIQKYGDAVGVKTGSQRKAHDAMVTERNDLVDSMAKMGMTKEAAGRLVDQYLKIPKFIPTRAQLDAGQALRAIANIKAQWNEIVHLPVAQLNAHYGVTGTPAKTKAGGGYISGPGTGTSDSIPAMVSNGEYVVKASAVRHWGVDNLNAINAYGGGGLVSIGFGSGGKGKSGKGTTHKVVTHKGKASTHRATVSSNTQDAQSIRDAITGAADLLGSYDFSKYATAIQRVTQAKSDQASAEMDLFAARQKVNAAGTPAEQAQAASDLAAAEQKLASAKSESAAASKAQATAAPTGRNILAGFTATAQKLVRFRRDLLTLKKRGLSPVILRQLLDAGIDSGGEMASALVKDANIAALNREQRIIGDQGSALGRDFGAYSTSSAGSSSSSGGTTGSTGSSSATAAVAISLADASKPFVVRMDSTQVWKGLLTLKKSKGGAALGLS